MGQIKVNKTSIEGLLTIEPMIHVDSRGYFMETYNANDMKDAGIDIIFVQDNQSCSTKGVLRGLHYQIEYPQTKLVRVIRGTVYDVAVDLRKNSKTYGKYHGEILSEDNKKQFLIPRGFGHAFLTLTDDVEFLYKTDNFYDKASEDSIIWNDPLLNIDWPVQNPTLSQKDLAAKKFEPSKIYFD